MTQYIALFRGINVGGNNILPMKELVALLQGLGCTDVKTYIQSGNAVFSIAQEDKDKLADAIGAAIQQSHGFQPKVLLLTASELKDAHAGSPFQTTEGKALHFYFLASTPTDPNLAALEELKSNGEDYLLGNSVFYLYAPNGIGRSKLAEKVERLLGVPVTARNLNTVNKLISMI
ncbi:MAG: DUF1697 domain-containing protein [Caldilineaceae bacterium]